MQLDILLGFSPGEFIQLISLTLVVFLTGSVLPELLEVLYE